MRKFLCVFAFILLPVFILHSQCFEENKTTIAGEYLKYQVSYHWGLIWIDAGMVDFKVDSVIYEGKPAYHFISTGRSYRKYDWIYKVRDKYESYADPDHLIPFYFKRNLKEGKYHAENSYTFNYTDNEIYAHIMDTRKAIKDTLCISPCLYDVLTATYATRNIDFSKHSPQDTIPLNFLLDNNITELKIRYLGRDTIENYNGITYPCLKFTSTMIESSLFAKGEPLIVYVTDDRNKTPILIISELIIGSVKVYLTEAKGLRYKGCYLPTKSGLFND